MPPTVTPSALTTTAPIRRPCIISTASAMLASGSMVATAVPFRPRMSFTRMCAPTNLGFIGGGVIEKF
jgi:hypothetical protein